MGRPGSWGQGKGWSLARSEVEPAPFSWGSQIVAMRGRGRWKVGACPCICLGSPKQAAPGPGIPATRGLFPLPPSPSWSHSSWPLLHFWPWTLCRALWKTWIPVYVLKYLAVGSRRIAAMHILTCRSFSTSSKMLGFQP